MDPFSDPFAPLDTGTPSANERTNVEHPEGASHKIVTTLKGGPGYEAPWIILHSSSVEEATNLLSNLFKSGYHERVQRAAAMFNGGNTSISQSSGGNPPGMQAPTCSHGERVYRTGTGSRGPWKAWFCPSNDKSEQCSPIWVK